MLIHKSGGQSSTPIYTQQIFDISAQVSAIFLVRTTLKSLGSINGLKANDIMQPGSFQNVLDYIKLAPLRIIYRFPPSGVGIQATNEDTGTIVTFAGNNQVAINIDVFGSPV